MDKEFKVIAAIADVHIGNKAISWKEYKFQIQKSIIEKFDSMTFLDGIVICGDTLHYQISLNSEYANVFQWFMSEIVRIGKKYNAFIRVIKGTRSHDLEQLETVRHYEAHFDVDFKIINDYYTETIDGHNYAYIAENYIHESIDDYYKEIFDKPSGYFDMLFMHGMIEPVQFVSQDSENLDTNAPIFSLKKLFKVSRLCIAGHIHKPMNFSDRFFYVGSALRTAHGEEEDKGWNVIVYFKKQGVYRVDKIVNEYAFKFSTLELTNRYIEQTDVDHIVDKVDSYISDNKIDRLHLKITCIDKEETVVKIELLKKYFNKNSNITATFKLLSEKSYEQEETQKKKKEVKPYLADGLDITERIRLWALLERNCRISTDDILRFITPKTLDRKDITEDV